MQQIRDLEARLDQIASENRLLAAAKIHAEKELEDFHLNHRGIENVSQEASGSREIALQERDAELGKLREALEWMQQEVTRLTEVNEGLASANQTLATTHSQLELQHNETHTQWQESSRELKTLRSQHEQLSTGMEEIVRHEIDTALAAKNAELRHLYNDLEMAKNKIRELQQQILANRNDEVLIARDEDYFDNACQQLCQHVQQWVLRFSKFSDTRVCRSTNEVRDDKIVERFDMAIVDGTDVDVYLADRIKRRDVFMSVVMAMIFEFIFSRYLFGMDREQRQKLKQLEKQLSEVGPRSAVHRWRALTLTLLCKREAFKAQRVKDTEAVAQEIYGTLARFLPPPQHLEKQILDSLRNVMKIAVDLSIEMRTQKAEYIMLPPLQPEYDPATGALRKQVYFNASLMNERSGETNNNAQLEAEEAVVRIMLFNLVVKKGDDDGEGEEEVVVCPAQVLVARPETDKLKRKRDKAAMRAVSADRMSIDAKSMRSTHSVAPSSMDMGNVI
jgi:archaellum component FlaC